MTVVSGRRPFASVADVWDPSRPVVIDHTTDKRDIETITQMLEGQIRMVAEGLRPGETIDETTLQATRQAYRTLREIAENLGSEDDVARLIEDEELAWVRELLLGIVTKN
ncbi:MAG: hypothetical protein HYY44_05305 [Deltaproteobacteria bacterium]|nr:hypothetical protein [Deltaproteobacteria bacterium]